MNTSMRINIMAAILAVSNLTAGTLTWDKDPATGGLQDGAGTWNGTTNTWWNGTANTTWSDGSDVVIGNGGTPGTISISGITPVVNSVTFAALGSSAYIISGGTINLGNASTLLASTPNTTISSILAGTGKGIDKSGAGNINLQGAHSYDGVTMVSVGQLWLQGSGTILNSSSFIVGGGTTFMLDNSSTVNNNRIGDVDVNMEGATFRNYTLKANTAWSEHTGRLKLNKGANTIQTVQASSTYAATLTFSNLVRSAGATVLFNGTGLGADTRNEIKFDTAPTLDSTGIIGGWAVCYDGAYGWATYDGTLGVKALATYQTSTDPSAWASSDNVKLTSGSVTLTADRTINSLVLSPATLNGSYKLTIGSGGVIIYTTAGNPTLNPGWMTAGTTSDPAELMIHRYGSQNVYVTTKVTDNAAGGKVSLLLYGSIALNTTSSTYTGDTIINNGGYIMCRAVGIMTSGIGKGNLVVRSGGTYDLYGNNQTINGLSGEGTVKNGSALNTLTVGAGDATSSFSGVLQDGNAVQLLALTKIGSGTLTLTGSANAYSGGTTISNGVLAIAKTNALGTGAIALSGGTLSNTVAMTSGLGLANTINLTSVGTLDTSAGNLLLTGAITNNGSMTKAGANGLLIYGAKTGTGALTVSAGYLGGTNVWAGTVTNLAMITAADTNTIGSLTVSNLVLAADSTLLWNYDNTNYDVINVTGTLTLPDVATVQVSRVSGKLPPLATLATYRSLAGSSTLQNWKVVGDSVQPRTYVRLNNNEVQLVSPAGTLISVF